jgi:hypothetical protein
VQIRKSVAPVPPAGSAHERELLNVVVPVWLNGWPAAFEREFSSVTRSYAGKAVPRYALVTSVSDPFRKYLEGRMTSVIRGRSEAARAGLNDAINYEAVRGRTMGLETAILVFA